jgi:hypothetical protein
MKSFLPQILGVIGIVISFFLGYLFAHREYELYYKEKNNTPLYIDVRTTKSSISIEEIPQNVFLRVNGERIQSGSINLKD